MLNIIRSIILIGALGFSVATQSGVIQYHPNSPAYIGGNFDPSYPGRIYPECLKRTSLRGESLLPNQKVGTPTSTQFFIKKVNSRRDMYRLLNVSLSISGSYGLFSGDASASLEQENTFSEETFTWVILGYSNFGKFILEPPIQLDPEAAKLIKDPAAFRNRCGTDYVGAEVRAVQAAAVFSIKNLSQSDKKVLEVAFNANYGVSGGPLNIGADGKYSEFVKNAATFGQIEVNVYAIGGQGVSALAPIITQINDPNKVLSTIQKYFENLTLESSVAVSYNTGSLQSLINRPNIETDIYNKFIADLFEHYEGLGAEEARLRNIYKAKDDWGLTNDVQAQISLEIKKIANLKQTDIDIALKCKDAFNNVNVSAQERRKSCSFSENPLAVYDRKLVNLTPKPYYLRYFVTNELIPNEEVINFSVRGNKLKNIQTIKKLNIINSSFESMSSIQIHKATDDSMESGTSIIMKDIPVVDLPIGLRIEMESGTVYLEQFVFTKASVAPMEFTQGETNFPGASKEDLKEADESGNLLPSNWKE